MFNTLPNILSNSPPTSIVDYYARGVLMDGVAAPFYNNPIFLTGWPGNGNVSPLFTTQDLLNGTIPGGFTGHMAAATAGNTPGFLVPDGNFNRYTYYRMLSQMGMDSAPEPATKLNLNYVNVGGYAASNFVPWTGDSNGLIEFPLGSGQTNGAALVFFTNAANRLLGTQTNFIIPFPITAARALPTT